MSDVAIAIIVAGFFICWELRDLTKVIRENKEEEE